MKNKKIFLIVLLCAQLMLFSGCWNYREVESLSIVSGFAVDSGSNGSNYHVTFDVLDAKQEKSNSAKSQLIEADGDTIFDAARNVVKKTDKRLYFGDSTLVVIGKQLAEKDLAPILDWMLRDHELRKDIAIAISKENTAQEIIQQKGLQNQINSSSLYEALMENGRALSKIPYVELYQVNNTLNEPGISLALPAVSVLTNMNEPVAGLDGMAVFQKDKLVGFLDDTESRNFMFVTGKIKGGLVLVKQGKDQIATLEIQESKAEIKPVFEGANTKMRVNLKIQCSLYEMHTQKDYGSEDALKKIEKSAESQIQASVKKSIETVQSAYGSDIFGFGSKIYKNNPKDWETVQSNWEEQFKTLPADVTVSVSIQNAGILQSKVM
ncbi:MAG: Ger(x)C family spore germination protein [Oscillospiraceae bacterium]|nr:Ger(x)C family spore germination protein [Oscillospiraceae bacterium]